MALIELDEQSGIPLWVQLRNRLMYLIDSGVYETGDRLPTARALAAELEVNYHTVYKVYISLERDGYISSKRGKGTFVTKSAADEVDSVARGDVILQDAIRECLELGLSQEDVINRFEAVIASFKE